MTQCRATNTSPSVCTNSDTMISGFSFQRSLSTPIRSLVKKYEKSHHVRTQKMLELDAYGLSDSAYYFGFTALLCRFLNVRNGLMMFSFE